MRLVGGPERCDDYFKTFPLAATPQKQKGETRYGLIPRGMIYSVIERDTAGEVRREWFTVACRGSAAGFSQMVYDAPTAAFYTSTQGKYIEQKVEAPPHVREVARSLLLRELSFTCAGQMQWAYPPRVRQA